MENLWKLEGVLSEFGKGTQKNFMVSNSLRFSDVSSEISTGLSQNSKQTVRSNLKPQKE